MAKKNERPDYREAVETRGDTVSVTGIFAFAVLMGVGALLMFLVLGGYFRQLVKHRAGAQHLVITEPSVPVEIDSGRALAAIRHREELILEGEPAWVDRKSGVVRIPIDRAIRLYLERQVRHD